ncbi:unnamed protein product, partial [Mesorhabditis belari]|uniref:Fibronectin type-III domain-containing protein n=1 Tax=Mesorhabditis belari TaxID=2138241 RepID=A0AAF3FK65_9BILA
MWLFSIFLLSFAIFLNAFTVVPYIQIDFAHYFRLAQCQAKCSEKYGILSKKALNDGSMEEYFNVSEEEAKFCEMGCQQNRRSKKLNKEAKEALIDGIRFWGESAANSSKVGSNPLASVQLLCQTSASIESDFDESITGRLGLVVKRGAIAPTRYIIQWRQRTFTMGFYDETQWITASIEHSTLVFIDGMIPGVQYRFQVTAVGPTGKLGDVVMSDWTEAISLKEQSKALVQALSTKNGYDTEHGVNSLITWTRSADQSCAYKVTYSNSTHTTMRDIEMDISLGILLTNLEFGSEYEVEISTLGFKSNDLSNRKASTPISTHFTSFTCAQVHGRGSLQCPPEPVDEFKVAVHSNGSIGISWKPSADIENILSYRIEYYSTEEFDKCDTMSKSVFLKPPTTEAQINVDPGCEYVLKMTNYDLIGREAFIERIFDVNVERSMIPINWKTISITVSILVILFLFCLLRCTLSPRCKQKVNEKKHKLVSDFS